MKIRHQRAELTGLIFGLELALQKNRELFTEPFLDVTIHGDSKYTMDGMNVWIHTWSRNGWVNSRGFEVANCYLCKRAVVLHNELNELGDLPYVWVPRERNVDADIQCNILLDEMEGIY
jgi:ribonuclease HI